MDEWSLAFYLNLMNYLAFSLIVCLFGDTSDQTVFSTVERFFYRGDFEQAAEMIEANLWTDESLWSEAGLLLELCGSGFSVPVSSISGEAFYPQSSIVSMSFSGLFQTEDSIRVILPVPSELPWQTFAGQPEIEVSGFDGEVVQSNGWLILSGLPLDSIQISFRQRVNLSPSGYPELSTPGFSEAMVPFPGESTLFDACLATETFWFGGDPVYREAVRLASGEPNPMRLLQRVVTYVATYFSGTDAISDNILLTSISELALAGELTNSLGGASLGASILRSWQIPAMVVPGRFGQSGEFGFLLATYVKPFGWMIISPYPEGFVSIGSFVLPEKASWFNGIPGVSFQAEYLGEDDLWYAIPINSGDFSKKA